MGVAHNKDTLVHNTVVLQELNYRPLHPPTVLGQNGAVKMRRPNQTSYEEETRVCCARGGRDGRDGLPGPPGPQGLAGVLGGKEGEGKEGEEVKEGEGLGGCGGEEKKERGEGN